MMTRQARPSAKIIGFDTHMILEAVPAYPSKHRNGQQAINRTPRHYAGALPRALPDLLGRDLIRACPRGPSLSCPQPSNPVCTIPGSESKFKFPLKNT